MNKLILSTVGEDNFILLAITEEEFLFIKQAFVNNTGDLHFRDWKISDIVAYGDSTEVTEAEVSRYISKGKNAKGEELYKCHKGIREGLKYESHFDALSSWSCALECLNFANLTVIIREKINKI